MILIFQCEWKEFIVLTKIMEKKFRETCICAKNFEANYSAGDVGANFLPELQLVALSEIYQQFKFHA